MQSTLRHGDLEETELLENEGSPAAYLWSDLGIVMSLVQKCPALSRQRRAEKLKMQEKLIAHLLPLQKLQHHHYDSSKSLVIA